jgi:ATP-dependent DNA ligase
VVAGAQPAPFPGFVEPCHPTLREEAPSGERWVHEIKFDGYRTQVHLQSRRGFVEKLGAKARKIASQRAFLGV